MRIKLDNAEKIQEYIRWHIRKAYNVPMLRTALNESLKMLDKYDKKEYPEVRIKIGS